ncbi:MAG: monofunctional biosynthetic peptidoglycan transglycosylase [Zoogloeaceae bacterium]|jgi:monofunctional biosynthetic peptidoglycan transglycosylase|nr:monofunctional biosynthetic peptidoglycan transglycosylase [Zoogloeaceae bacterium]
MRRLLALFHGVARCLKWGALLVVGVFLAAQLWFMGWIFWWKHNPPQETSFMRLRLDELREKDPAARLRWQWMPYDEISTQLKRALIAAEDARFVDHEGFDWRGIQLAIEKNQEKGRFVAGGSTISQQLAKNLFLNPGRSVLRKGQEALITLMLEAVWDKKRILEVYLNAIEWGNGVFGAEAAARHYYQTSAARLSAPQAARMAAMVPNPRYYDRHRNARGLRGKTDIILKRMPVAQLP